MLQPLEQPSKIDSTAVEWQKGICGICPAGCWIEAGLQHGRLVDIRQDGDNTLGMICRRGKHASEIVYSQHRLMYPMRRTRTKGHIRIRANILGPGI